MSVNAPPAIPDAPPPVVLVADDDAAVRDSTAGLLRRAGFECLVAANAVEVRAQLKQQAVDLIIADIVMPGNVELELIGELASAEDMPAIVVVTGHPSLESAKKAIGARVVAYLTKPVAFDELLAVVRREAGLHQVRRFLRRRRQRLEVVLADLRQIEVAAASPAPDAGGEALDAYLALLTEHMLSAVTDLRLLVGLAALRSPGDDARAELAGTRSFVLLEALRHAIAVLDRTKRAFKSRELAELRREFEALLVPPAGAPPAGAADQRR